MEDENDQRLVDFLVEQGNTEVQIQIQAPKAHLHAEILKRVLYIDCDTTLVTGAVSDKRLE